MIDASGFNFWDIPMNLSVRRIVSLQDVVTRIINRRLKQTYHVSVCAAVIENPFLHVSGLGSASNIAEFSSALGELTSREALKNFNGAKPDVFGKAAIVGLRGEVFHGSELIHTKQFGDFLREATGGSAVVTAAEKLGLPGGSIDLSLRYAHDGGGVGGLSVHHLTSYTFSIPSGPASDEIAIVSVFAVGSRPDWRGTDEFTDD